MAAQQPQQPPVPNIVNLQATVNGMAAEGNTIVQSVQAYNAHQQQPTTELSIQQQINAITQSITNMEARMDAKFWNLNAMMQNSKVHYATGALVIMRGVEKGPNPQVPVNQAIPNFPGTPDQISQMNVLQCRNVLTSLDMPIPQGHQVGLRQLRTAVRGAIGLPAL